MVNSLELINLKKTEFFLSINNFAFIKNKIKAKIVNIFYLLNFKKYNK